MPEFKVGQWVRVKRGMEGPRQPARIVAVRAKQLVVRPVKHFQTEVVDKRVCQLWKSRNAQLGLV